MRNDKKQTAPEPESVAKYVNEMNAFFARFDQCDFSAEQSEVMGIIRNRRKKQTVITEEEVVRELKRVSVSKATGPDGVPARASSSCGEQLTPVLQRLFQDSVDQGEVPPMWKLSEIKSIAKILFPEHFQDFRSTTVASNIAKCLENIIMYCLTKFLSTQARVLSSILVNLHINECRSVSDNNQIYR